MTIAALNIKPADDPFALYNDYWEKPVALDAIPDPERWYLIVRPIGKKLRTKGGLILPDQMIDDQDWTHGAGVVIKTGPSCYRGRKYADLGLTPEDAPQPGTLVVFESRAAPRRIRIDGQLYLIIIDDTVWGRATLDELSRLSFTI